MLKPSTALIARQVAESLTRNGVLLTPKLPHVPVAVMTDHFCAPIEADSQSMTPRLAEAVCELHCAFNNEQTGSASSEFDRLTELMASGLQSMLTTVRTRVVPACKLITQAFNDTAEGHRLPNINVEPYHYHDIHSAPGLTEHVMDYARIRYDLEYRSFQLDVPSPEKLVEWVSNTQHMPSEEVHAWIRDVSTKTLVEAFRAIWGGDITVKLITVPFLNSVEQPFYADHLLAAYLLSGYLCNNPQIVKTESVSLEEWTAVTSRMHGVLGATLYSLYERRARHRKQERVVLRYDAANAVADGNVTVRTNGDVYPEWSAAGNNIKVLLGAAVSAQGLVAARDLNARATELVAVWDRKHYLIRQTRLDRFIRNQRQLLKTQFTYPQAEVKELLATEYTAHTSKTLEDAIATAVGRVTDRQLEDIPRLITELVCTLFFKNTPYLEFLTTMDRIANDGAYDTNNPREIATLTVIEMTGAWLVSQVASQRVEFKPSVAPPEPNLGEVINEVEVSKES